MTSPRSRYRGRGPREAPARDQVKFRGRPDEFASQPPDETVLGFGFARDERGALIAPEPEKFFWSAQSGLRCQWIRGRLAASAAKN